MPKVSDVYLEKRRDQILRAAKRCFARNGFKETTIQDICEEADVSPGAVYRYFTSKEDVIEASVEQAQEVRQVFFSELSQKGDLAFALDEALGIPVKELTQPAVVERMRLRVQLYGEAARNPRIRAAVHKDWRNLIDHFATIVRQAQSSGQINPSLDPEAVSSVLLSIYDGLLVQKMVESEISVDQYLQAWKALIHGGFWTGQK